jgi:AmmeMemoRadiSam system protein B
LGDLEVNSELTDLIRARLPTGDDAVPDNTVEIQLPFIAHLLGMPRVVHLRCPPSGLAVDLGNLLGEYTAEHPDVSVVGSTDLTHYGPAYGFADHGHGPAALSWVKEENDKRFVDALLAGDPESIIAVAGAHRCACSAGGAAAAAAYARVTGCTEAELVDYYTSYDVAPNESFVGYAGVGYYSESE